MKVKLRKQTLIATAAMLLCAACGKLPEAPQTEAATRAVTETVEVAPSHTPVQVTDTPMIMLPTATLAPLDLKSGIEAIRERMTHSHENWEALWVQYHALEFPPQGSDALIYPSRLQVWVRQPGEILLLCGPMGDGNPDYLFVSDGRRYLAGDLGAGGSTQEGEVVLNSRGYFFPQVAEADRASDCPPDGMVINLVGAMLFPADLARREGSYTLSGEATIAGRAALIVEFTPQPGGLIFERLRIDVLTGMLLQHEVLDRTGGDLWVVSDFQVDRIYVDPELAPELFRLEIPAGVFFQEGPAWTITEEPFVRPGM